VKNKIHRTLTETRRYLAGGRKLKQEQPYCIVSIYTVSSPTYMMLNPEGIPFGANGGTEAAPDPNAALRFEDLTIDDDLSLLERVVRYVRSGIALQRLVHVKMIAETAKAVG
jgi:hypothetical protein